MIDHFWWNLWKCRMKNILSYITGYGVIDCTKYEVSASNNIRDMAKCLVFRTFHPDLFSQGHFSQNHLFGHFHIFSFSIIHFLFSVSTFLRCVLGICMQLTLNTIYYGTTFGGVPGSFKTVSDWMHVWPE